MRTGELVHGRHVLPVMGTVVSFDLRTAVPNAALDAAVDILTHADQTFSMYQATSDMARLSRGEIRLADCHTDVEEVLALCAQATADTDGYFSTMLDGRLDPTGLVKGWAIKRASDALLAAGSRRHVVNGGGDIQFVGTPAPGARWKVGIANPHRPGSIIVTAECSGGAFATSGTAERGHHIVNPRTGSAAEYFSSVSITAASLIDADVLATACFARGEAAIDWIESMPGVEGFFIGPGNRLRATSRFPLAPSDST